MICDIKCSSRKYFLSCLTLKLIKCVRRVKKDEEMSFKSYKKEFKVVITVSHCEVLFLKWLLHIIATLGRQIKRYLIVGMFNCLFIVLEIFV